MLEKNTMSDQQPDLLELIAQRIGAKDDRAWAERLDGAELTRQEAVGKVTEILREQLVRLSGGSKSLGMNGFLGLLWVEEAFPSLPSLPLFTWACAGSGSAIKTARKSGAHLA